MKVKRYIKKPVMAEAVLLTEENDVFVLDWIGSNGGSACLFGKGIIIKTLEGEMEARHNEHYIVKGVKGEFYPVRVDIFKETYEEMRNEGNKV